MAPNKPREESIERTAEYDEFLDTLAEYHEKRGTVLDREPKVGNRHIDLLRLYKRVTEEGGYDKVSDTKGNKLAWRRLAGEFLPGSSNLTTQAFLVKTAYYKNLAAYEISTIHKRDPPPKEILEEVSAKGGDLLTRTVENYLRPASRETERLRGDEDSEESEGEDESKTPRDKMDVDDPGSMGRRSLRHAPPQRVLFQPEVSRRETRQSTGNVNSPQPNGVYGTSGAAMTIANYEPRTNVPSTMKPVNTPSNNPEYFNQLKRKYIVNRKNRPVPLKGMMLPGTGFPGPNIYIRALHALRSKEPEEEAYALHHLVKISHERGDKYRFDQFPGLMEALIEKVIQAASLYYDVHFEISYVEEDFNQPSTLNGLDGTADLLRRIQALQKIDRRDDLLPEEDAKTLNMINEAALILRNMVMLQENASLVSTVPILKDLIVILLSLPKLPSSNELRHYGLEIAQETTRFWDLETQSPVYLSLLAQIDYEDRGNIITSLRALGRIGLDIPDATNKLTGIPVKILKSICDWLLVEDDELRVACLDFLYLFTGFVDNVGILVNEIDVEVLVYQLVRLLQFGAQAFEERRGAPKASKQSSQADDAPKLSSSIIEQLVSLDEPERSSQWLRTCYEEDPTGEITQIQLWTAYNAAFSETVAKDPAYKSLMPAKDFITNVSTTFVGAQAQVITTTSPPKYTIKGIRPRSIPLDPTTKKAYLRCCWHPPSLLNGISDSKHSTPKNECGEFTSGVKAMWEHVVSSHLNIPRDDTGKWLLEQKPDIDMENGDAVSATKPTKYFCHWGGCTHFSPAGTDSAYEAGQHIKTHLPDTSLLHAVHAKHNRTPSNSTPLATSTQARHENSQPQFSQPVGLGSLGMGARHGDKYGYGDRPVSAAQVPAQIPAPNFRYYNTTTDEGNDAAGLPFSALLVLRNLARQLGKLPPPSSVYEIPDSPVQKHKRTLSESSPDHRRTSGGKKPRLSDAAKENRDRDMERDEQDEQEARTAGWVPRVFAPVKEQLSFVMAHNLTLRNHMGPLFKAMAEGGVKKVSSSA